MGLLDGKVAFVTGVARGQGRSHALRLAEEGADIIGVDLCAQLDSVPYPMSTRDDLDETVKLVEALDRRIVAREADVRSSSELAGVLGEGVATFGRLDIVLANAGIWSGSPAEDLDDQMWDDMIDINLTGVFRTARAAIPHLKAGGRGGSMVLTSSTAGMKGTANIAHYSAAKHGVVGLVKSLASELAPHSIRVNSVHPTTVDTGMVQNQAMYDLFRPDLGGKATQADAVNAFMTLNALPVPWVDAVDISNAVVWLCSDQARYITGAQLPVDAGSLVR
ncbi:mycofactocin-coupled SDR family oxidoreductase [Pseudonocardia pini]|uniref:mycofactocin-coupled SDR family oxidoreductase n=1 Tax=Pseudonocardia pini TaxID=2758030 RepID=UPI0015F0F097|nr:mycofactocin-coupled SDR family oxidoreductase [Pseudonocardia pini]